MAQQARLNIIEPSGVRRSMPLTTHGLVIGRDPTCDIAINYERVSRQHAQIAYDGRDCYVTDLDSKNGTYLGKSRLAPNTPTPWPPDQPLRVGDVYFNLEMPRFQDLRREEAGQMETMAGYVPPHLNPPKKSQRTLWLVLGAIALLCVCGAVGGLAIFLLGV